MINQLTEGFDVSDQSEVDVSLFQNEQQKDIFLKSVALVALADGKVLAEEKELLEKFSAQLGLDAGYGQSIMTEVGIALLSYFRGVTVTRAKWKTLVVVPVWEMLKSLSSGPNRRIVEPSS